MAAKGENLFNLEVLQNAVSATTGLILRGDMAPTVHQVTDASEFYDVLLTKVRKYLGEFGAQRLKEDASQIPSLLGGWYVFAPTDVFINMTAMEELVVATGSSSKALLVATTLHELAHVYLACGVFDLADGERSWEGILTGQSFNTARGDVGYVADEKADLKAPIAGLLELGISAGFVEIEEKVLTPLEAEMLAQCIARRSCEALENSSVSNALELIESKFLAKHAPDYLTYRNQAYANLDAVQFKDWLRTEVNANRDKISRIFQSHFGISYAACESSLDDGYPLLARMGSKRGILTVLDDQCRAAACAAGSSASMPAVN